MGRSLIGGIGFVLVVLAALDGGSLRAQGPTVETGEALPMPGGGTLSPAPGALGSSSLGGAPGGLPGLLEGSDQDRPFLGGAPGTITPRVPTSISTPGRAPTSITEGGVAPLPTAPTTELPIYGSLSQPGQIEDEGPPNGLTLDMAIEQLLRENLDLRARFLEIPQADADILTASLRANPIFYADSQLVPYGTYTEERPGGQTQYDVNVSYPLDITHKRRARTQVACRAKRVIEAQFQDAVRLEIANLYASFVDVLAARETARFARASVENFERILAPVRSRLELKLIPPADVNRVTIQRDYAAIGLADAEERLRAAYRNLATLLNIPPDQAEGFQVRGSIFDRSPPPPGGEDLVRMALLSRPDLNAFRLGVHRAYAEVDLARANRLADIYVLYQPYTFQNNAPINKKSPTSWALGVTVPLPIYNRNQGNIRKAQVNVNQTQVELKALERRVITEVQQAEREYLVSRSAVERVTNQLLPAARQVRDTARVKFAAGEVDSIELLTAEREFNDVFRQFRDTLVRHRRSMLTLNTAVGRRILP